MQRPISRLPLNSPRRPVAQRPGKQPRRRTTEHPHQQIAGRPAWRYFARPKVGAPESGAWAPSRTSGPQRAWIVAVALRRQTTASPTLPGESARRRALKPAHLQVPLPVTRYFALRPGSEASHKTAPAEQLPDRRRPAASRSALSSAAQLPVWRPAETCLDPATTWHVEARQSGAARLPVLERALIATPLLLAKRSTLPRPGECEVARRTATCASGW